MPARSSVNLTIRSADALECQAQAMDMTPHPNTLCGTGPTCCYTNIMPLYITERKVRRHNYPFYRDVLHVPFGPVV